jgi:hypothetical protein
MLNKKIWVKPTVKVYTKNDVLGKTVTGGEDEGAGGSSKTGS